MRKIVLFNHKGGVSKTTSTFNIGWMLADMGFRVLLVDADPQCNLTSIFLGDKFDEYYTVDSTRHDNIKDGVSVAFDGKPVAIEAINCPSAIRNQNLFLLPGHMNLSEYDAQLSFAQNASQAMSSLKSLPGAFNALITKTATQLNIDYVFIDLNPGLSSINQNLFLICDAFIVPTNPDTFSLMAIRSLGQILPRWVNWKRQNISAFADSAYPLPECDPKFVGTIAQRFNIRNGRPTLPYQTKIEEICRYIATEFVSKMCDAGMMFNDSAYKNASIDTKTFCLSEVKDFQGLSPKSQKANVPVFSLSDEELNAQGAPLEGMKANRQTFYDLYYDIAKKICDIVL